jgi:hypothetical protein
LPRPDNLTQFLVREHPERQSGIAKKPGFVGLIHKKAPGDPGALDALAAANVKTPPNSDPQHTACQDVI